MHWLAALFTRLLNKPRTVSGRILPPPTPDGLGLRALGFAKKEIGNGEQGGNNQGSHIRRWRAADGTGGAIMSKGAWCAVFVSYCIRLAARWDPPFKTSRSAKRLIRNAAEHGQVLERPEPGALIAWHRGPGTSWRGHIGICESYTEATDTLTTVEGNRGKYPSAVEEYIYPDGAWRKRLYKIVRV